MQRDGMVAADGFERTMRRSAGPHAVLGVDLEEAARLRPREDRLQVLGLEARPGQSRDRMRRKTRLRGFPLRMCGQVSSHMPSFSGARMVRLHRCHGAVFAVRQLDRRAGSALDKLPRVALEIDGRGALAGRAGARGAVVLALEGDAEALLLMGGHGGVHFRLGQRGSGREARKRARKGAGEDERGDGSFCRHWLAPNCGLALVGHTWTTRLVARTLLRLLTKMTR